jgi:hypothetical protein
MFGCENRGFVQIELGIVVKFGMTDQGRLGRNVAPLIPVDLDLSLAFHRECAKSHILLDGLIDQVLRDTVINHRQETYFFTGLAEFIGKRSIITSVARKELAQVQ